MIAREANDDEIIAIHSLITDEKKTVHTEGK